VGVVGGAASIEKQGVRKEMLVINKRFAMMTLVVLSIWHLSGQLTCAQVRDVWTARYGDQETGNGYALSSTLDPQGYLLVTGILVADYLTFKYDKHTGQPIWAASFRSGVFSGPKVAVDLNSDVIVCGAAYRSATRDDFVTIKYDGQTGQQLWTVRYNGPSNDRDRAVALSLDLHGDVYVTGYSTNTGTGMDYTTIKYDGQTGQQLWVARYNGSSNGTDVARAITLDSNGNPIITGYSTGVGTGLDYATVKYDGQTGQQLWAARYNGTASSDDRASAIAVDLSGDIYVTGGTDEASRQQAYTTIKYDGRSGQALWISSSTYTGSNATSIAVNPVGDVFVTGASTTSANSLTLRYSGQDGQLLWVQALSGVCQALVLDGEGDVYVAGRSPSLHPGPIGDFRTVKLDGRTGRLLWQRTAVDAIALSLVVDEDGNVYVTGYEGPQFEENYLTIKYEQAPPGDVNLDFCVDDVDLLRILDTFGQSGERPEDVNRDGVVDDQDLLTVLFHFGRGCGEE
jgi:hypothetical protein